MVQTHPRGIRAVSPWAGTQRFGELVRYFLGSVLTVGTWGEAVRMLLVSRIWIPGLFLKAWGNNSIGKGWIRMNLFIHSPAEQLKGAAARR